MTDTPPARSNVQRHERDPHCGPVPESAWERDAETRRTTGRIEIFNATRPGGLDGWTMDAAHVRYTKTDMETRCEVERIPGSSPQRIIRWRHEP